MKVLAGWQNFYVIVGSSASALIGLQFVALSLISSRPAPRPDAEAGSVFSTPTIVHFAIALGLAAVLSAPWDVSEIAADIVGLAGICGFIYSLTIIRRMRKQSSYKPEFEDWLFHAILPVFAYVLLAGSALAARVYLTEALFATAASALLLLFIGIHNAWDAVTYHVLARGQTSSGKK